MSTYGYARVSTRDQNLDRQLHALIQWGVSEHNIVTEQASGKDFERPEYLRLVKRLKPGDVLVIKSIDRLGRNYDEVINEWRSIVKEKHVDIVVLDMPLLDTRQTINGVTGTLLCDIVLELLSYIAHVERENTKQRQAEGIQAAQARGIKFGRPKKKKPDEWQVLKNQIKEGYLTRVEAARRVGVSEATIRRWLAESEEG